MNVDSGIYLSTSCYKINSTSRISSSNIYNAIINLGFDMIGTYKLKAAYIPNTAYNISSSNNVISIHDNTSSVTSTFTVTPGFYTAGSLITAVQTGLTAMTGMSGVFTVTYSTITGLVTISSTGGAWYLVSVASNLYSVLGFTTIGASSAATSQTGTSVLNLTLNLLCYHMVINSVTNYIGRNNEPQATFIIPIQSAVLYPEIYEESKQFITFQTSTRQLRIEIRDELGAFVQLLTDWYIILEPMHTGGIKRQYCYLRTDSEDESGSKRLRDY